MRDNEEIGHEEEIRLQPSLITGAASTSGSEQQLRMSPDRSHTSFEFVKTKKVEGFKKDLVIVPTQGRVRLPQPPEGFNRNIHHKSQLHSTLPIKRQRNSNS